jgi:hypothetical protein
MDAQLMEAVAEILADALLADLEANLESEELPAVTPDTATSPTGIGSRSERLAPISTPTPDAA